MRSEGRVVTPQQIANMLRRCDEYKSDDDTTAVIKQLCKDPDTVFVLRYQLKNRESGASEGWLDLIRIPGSETMHPVNPNQNHRLCENLGPLFTGSVIDM